MLTLSSRPRRATLALVTVAAVFATAMLCVIGIDDAYGAGSGQCDSSNPMCTGWLSIPGSPGTTSSSAGGGSSQACPAPPSGPGYPTDISLDCNGCHWIRVYAMPTDINATGTKLEESQQAYDDWQESGEQGILDELACYPGPTRYLMYFQSPGTAAQHASDTLPLDPMTPQLGPKSDGMALVNAPIYLWISTAEWRQSHTTTIAIANATLTLTATPISVTWTMGDGHQLTCDGPGAAWSRYNFDSYHACAYTYRRSSATQPMRPGDAPGKPSYTITAVVNYHVSWTCHGGTNICGNTTTGDLGIHPGEPSTTQLPVGEVQSVIVG